MVLVPLHVGLPWCCASRKVSDYAQKQRPYLDWIFNEPKASMFVAETEKEKVCSKLPLKKARTHFLYWNRSAKHKATRSVVCCIRVIRPCGTSHRWRRTTLTKVNWNWMRCCGASWWCFTLMIVVSAVQAILLLAVAYDIYSRAVLNLSRAKNIRVKTDIMWFKFLTTVKNQSRTM